jgi:hypothetical protein
VAATSRRSSEASFDGAAGVVWSRNSWATPPRLHELNELLLLRRGADCGNFQSVGRSIAADFANEVPFIPAAAPWAAH